MTMLHAVIIAVIQGLTEFLPVSSSGHLVLAKSIMGVHTQGAVWEVALHVGTLISVIVVFRAELLHVAMGIVGGVRAVIHRGDFKAVWNANDGLRTGWYVALGTLPAAIVGLSLRARIESLFDKPAATVAMLFITGTVLWIAGGRNRTRADARLSMADSLAIGAAQAVALVPGISRSGMTISAGLLRGVQRGQAVVFSMLLLIPATLGAAVIELRDCAGAASQVGPVMVMAVLVSAVTGYTALKLLMRVVLAGRLRWFAVYCWIVSIIGTTLLWTHGRQ